MRGACRDRSQLFFSGASFDQELAVAICKRECTVRVECEAETRVLETLVQDRFGVRAGYTPEQRRGW